MNNEKSKLMQKEETSKGEKVPAWYEILISDYFIDYVKSDPDYVKDFENENSVIMQLWSVLDGLLYGSIVFKYPTKVKDMANSPFQSWNNDWVLKGYWAFVNDENNERDTSIITKSIREIDENKTFYEHDPSSLSTVQLAYLIRDRASQFALYEFAVSGDLKRYLLALRKRHEETTKNESSGALL